MLEGVKQNALAQRWLGQPEETRDVQVVTALGLLVFLPWLGAVGFWDPWEPHYGEVARAMIERRDFVHPYWESAYFFSKPALPLWMMALGMIVAGTNFPERGVSIWTEWCVRVPFMLLMLFGIVALFVALRRRVSRRVAFIAAFACITSPLMFFLARQAVTDTPFIALHTAALACLMVAMLGERDEPEKPGWLYAFYALAALATLAKGFMGFLVPGAIALLYLVATGEWWRLRRLRLWSGSLVFLAIAAPWYVYMSFFPGVDDESKTFFQRFIIWDHWLRLVRGVHTTTPGGSFVYFIEQLGFGMFPWVAVMPGALAQVARLDLADASPRARAQLFAFCWAVVAFIVPALSATKFHHYATPALPAIFVLCALFLDRVWEEGLVKHAALLLLGLALYAMVARDLGEKPSHFINLFVYNYERPFPDRDVNVRPYLIPIFAGAAALALTASPRLRWTGAWILHALRWLLAKVGIAAIGAAPAAEDAEEKPSDRRTAAVALLGYALLSALLLSWWYWRKLTPHWTQRDLFWSYYEESKPDEPIAAYSMNWRGETFYSRNLVRQIKDAQKIKDFVAAPGREFILTEHSRLQGLKTTLGSAYRVKPVDKSSNKFVLVVVE